MRLSVQFGISSQHKSCGLLQIRPSPSDITLYFQFLPAGNVFFCVILLVMGLAELKGMEGHISLPNWVGFSAILTLLFQPVPSSSSGARMAGASQSSGSVTM